MFTYFKKRKERKAKARALYEAAEAQARLPVFYESYAVPDTVDGRFEMICLHCYILMRRLKAAGEEKTSQALFDVLFRIMDKSLREMGVGDLGVPKHMKRMMQGFNGRANHYEQALRSDNNELLHEVLIRNVYGTVENPPVSGVQKIALYVRECVAIKSTEAIFAELDTESKLSA